MARSTFSRYFRLVFAVALIFALMTPLGAAAQEAGANFSVDLPTDNIFGWEWAADSSVTIDVDDPGTPDTPDLSEVAPTDVDGHFDHHLGIDVQPGFIIDVADGVIAKSHIVIDLSVTDVDVAGDTTTGTAPAFTTLTVAVWDPDPSDTSPWREVVADGDGIWFADFSVAGDGQETFDIVPWFTVNATQADADGDRTQWDYYVPNPALRADPVERAVFGDEWPPGSSVAVTLNGVDLGSATVGDDTYFWINDVDLTPGDVITGTDGNTSKEMVVEGLTYSVDPGTDRVYGEADPGDNWINFVHDPHAFRSEVADGAGLFTADFSVPGDAEDEQDVVDIGPGTAGSCDLCDLEGDCTIWRWYVPRPIFRADPQNGGIWGHEWYDVSEVTITVDGTDVETVGVDENGDWGTGVDPTTLSAGTLVTVTGGDTTKTLVLTDLEITLVDEAADAVLGGATTGSEVWVEIHDQLEGVWRRVVADAVTGEWTADFTDPISDENGEGSQDFAPGVHGAAYQEDDDGDTTWIDWWVRQPRIGVEPQHEGLWGGEWAPNSSVGITINGDDYGSLPTDEWGNWGEGWDPGDLDIQADDEITVTDSVTTKTHIVTPLAITNIDIATDEMSGTAQPDHGFSIWVHDSDAYEWVVADSAGDWTVDWSAQVDIVRGSNGNSQECDDDGDCTWASWGVPNPSFSVETPHSVWSQGEGWVEGRTVTLVVDDDEDDTNGTLYTDTVAVERWGPEPWEVGWGFDLTGSFEIVAVEHFVTVDDGVDIAKALWVEDIQITDIDEAAETIAGTAPPLARVEVNADTHDHGTSRSVDADAAGNWIADFSVPGDESHEQDTFDIGPDTWGGAQVFDDDGDSSHRGWEVQPPPNPSFSVQRPFALWSTGDGWVEGRTVTFVIDDDDNPGNGTLYTGDVLVERWGPEPWEVGWSFDEEPELFEILPGYYVSVDDGVDIAKALWVDPLEITDIDDVGDTISGIASAFATVEVHVGYPDEEPQAYRTVEVDAGGFWMADFSAPGDQAHEQAVFDIEIETGGAAQVFDEDGDSTHWGWFLEPPPEPAFFVRPDGDEIWGHEWFGGPEVTITFDDDEDPGNGVLFETVVETWDEYFEVYVGDEFDIHAGQHVVVTDGEFTKSHWVTELAVTDLDTEADLVHGTATPGAEVFVGSSLFGVAWEHLNFQFGPDNRNPDSLNEHLAFRQAVAYAIDRDLLAAELAKAAYGLDSYVDVFIPELSQDAWAQYPYDPAVAAALVGELCLDLERDCAADPPVAVLTTSGNNDTRAQLADLLVPMLGAAGIELQLDLEEDTFFDSVFAGTTDLSSWAWVGTPILSDLVTTHWVVDPEERFDVNPYQWGTPGSSQVNDATERMAELVGLMAMTDDRAQLEAYLAEAEQILADEVVFIPLFAWDGGVWGDDPIEVPGPYRVVTADADGDWTANFSVPWEDQEVLDIVFGTGGFAEESDDDGDATHAGWLAAAPSATVEGHVYLDGAPLPDVEVFMAPDEVFTCTDADGYFVFEDVSAVGDAFLATGPAYSDAGCGNTAFVDPDGMPLMVAGEDGIFLADGYEYLEFNVEYAAAIQYVRVEDITGGTPTPVDGVPIRAFDRNDEEFVEVFGHEPDPADYPAILEDGIGEIAWIDWTGAALDHEPGLAEMRYPYVSDVLILAELDPVLGAQSSADEFVENLDGIVEGKEIVFQIGEAGPVVTADDVVMYEGDRNSKVLVTLRLSEPVDSNVTVTWTTADGSALAGEDYVAASGTVTFQPGETERTLRLRILGDTMYEADEWFEIVVLTADGAEIGDPGAVTLLNDDAEAPELSVEDVAITEGDRRKVRVGVPITLFGAAAGRVTFTVTTVAGTASPGQDFIELARTFRIRPGSTSATIYVTVFGDTLSEGDETFTVEVSDLVGATLGDGIGEVTILDDD